jgi:release factor glutamine methyltransferase
VNLKDVQNTFHKELDSLYGKEEVDNFFFMLTDAFYKVSRLDLALNTKYAIDNYDAIEQALQLLKNEQPIQYILGETEFCGYPFKVNASTLIPRPETEELVEWIVKQQYTLNKPQLHILDIGTGSGCIAISLAKKLPEAKVYALDISEKALNMSRQNAELNNVNVEFIEANILKPDTWSSNLEKLKFDIIVSNPPYVREKEKNQMKANVLNNEPHLALFVKDENPLQFYKAIIKFTKSNLNSDGMLFFEINEFLGKEMIQLMVDSNLKDIVLKQDIFKKDRMIKGRKNNE